MADDSAAVPKTRKPRQSSIDAEASAIAGCARALTGLADKPSKLRVLDYLKVRFDL